MEWISVEDRLPDDREQIFTLNFCRGLYIQTDYAVCSFHDGKFYEGGISQIVTHWMRPQAPEQLETLKGKS
jgi:hypothetical protein